MSACIETACSLRVPCMAKFTVLHTEHCTLEAPRMYISSVLHPPHSSCAISVPDKPSGRRREHAFYSVRAASQVVPRAAPAGGTGVMLLHCAGVTRARQRSRSVTRGRRHPLLARCRSAGHTHQRAAHVGRALPRGRACQSGTFGSGSHGSRARGGRTPAGRTAACHIPSI